jgi:hypothetical protein
MNPSNLPKWAKERISTLERQRDDALRTLKEFLDKQTKSRVWVEEFHSHATQKHYIQTDRIRFELDDNRVIEVTLKEDLGDTYIQLRATGNLADMLLVVPECSNTIKVTAGDFK